VEGIKKAEGVMSMKEVIILGVNGNCIDIAKTIELLAKRGAPMRVIGFLDDNPAMEGRSLAGCPILRQISDVARFPEARFVNGIGSPRCYKRKPDIGGCCIRRKGLCHDEGEYPHQRRLVSKDAVLAPFGIFGS